MKYLFALSLFLFSNVTYAETLNHWLGYEIYVPDNKEDIKSIESALKNQEKIDDTISLLYISKPFFQIQNETGYEENDFKNRTYLAFADLKTGSFNTDTASSKNSIRIKHIAENQFSFAIEVNQLLDLIEKKTKYNITTEAVMDSRSLERKNISLSLMEQKIITENGIVFLIKRLPNDYGVLNRR